MSETFWQEGDRVISRFWQKGEPIGTVIKSEFITDKVRLTAFDKARTRTMEWTTVKFDDGYQREYAVNDLIKAPLV